MNTEIKTANVLLGRVLTEARTVAEAMADDAVGVVVMFPRFHVQVRTEGEPVADGRPAPNTAPLGEAIAELMTEGLSRLPVEATAATMGMIDGGIGTIEIAVSLLFGTATAEFVSRNGIRVGLFVLKAQEIQH